MTDHAGPRRGTSVTRYFKMSPAEFVTCALLKLRNPMINCVARCAVFYSLLIGRHNLSSGYTNFHRVIQFLHQVTKAGENLKHLVTLVRSGGRRGLSYVQPKEDKFIFWVAFEIYFYWL